MEFTEIKPSQPLPSVEPKNVTKLAWSELDRSSCDMYNVFYTLLCYHGNRYQSMTVRERKDMTTELPRGPGWGGKQHDNVTTQPPGKTGLSHELVIVIL